MKWLDDITSLKNWRIWKLKLIDARLYFVSMFVGLLTGLVAVPYHFLLQFFFNTRKSFFDSHPLWYWHIPLFLSLWGILIFVAWLVQKMPLITGGGIPQTRGAINGRIVYKHPFIELMAKFVGGVLSLSAGLSLGREGPSVQIGSYVGCLISKWTHILSGERGGRACGGFCRPTGFFVAGYRIHRTLRCAENGYYHPACRGCGRRRSQYGFSYQSLSPD